MFARLAVLLMYTFFVFGMLSVLIWFIGAWSGAEKNESAAASSAAIMFLVAAAVTKYLFGI